MHVPRLPRLPRFLRQKLWTGLLLATAAAALPACPEPTDAQCAGFVGCGQGGAGGVGNTGSSTGDAGNVPTGEVTATVSKYEYKFDVTTAEGQSKLLLDVASPGGDCWNVSSELWPLLDVTWDDMTAKTAAYSGGVFRVCGLGSTGPTVSVGTRQTVPEKTWFGLDVGFNRKKDLAGGSFMYLLSWVGGCDRFGPCDDDPSRMSAFHFEVTHPAGTVVLCPGTRTASGTLTTCDVKGAPTYSAFAIAADPLWKESPLGKYAGVNLVFYEVPGGGLKASLDPTKVGAFMDWISSKLGGLPYGEELRIAGGPTSWLGFEHPANIILHQKLNTLQTSYQDATMHVLMHEIIHQWAGDRTTLAEHTDFVWKEATAEYLAYVFEDEAISAAAGAATRAYWDGIWAQSSHYPRPTDTPAPAVEDLYGDVYGPGPMVLYLQLEALIGRENVIKGIQSFLSQPGGRSVAELRDAMSTASGQDLKAYFDAWVFGQGVPEWPTFAAKADIVGGEATVTVTQQNASGKVFPCAVEVALKGTTGNTRVVVDFGLAPQSATATATVAFPDATAAVTIDPDHKLIGWESTGPLIVQKKPVWIF